jgi:DNA-binding LytR/AlgR family response regulator
VLIVEDNFVVADSLRELVTAYGGSVSAMAPDVKQASHAARRCDADVALLDIDLKGENVTPLARELRRLGIASIFVSGYADEDLLPQDLRSLPRLDKPVDPERLIELMLKILGRDGRR